MNGGTRGGVLAASIGSPWRNDIRHCPIEISFFFVILDRHTDIVKLKAELKKKDELRDAAKISHNILVEKLRVAEAKLKRVQGQ